MRRETDSMGEVEVADDVYWGAQTQRSLKYFRIGDDIMPIEVIHAYGILKRAAAEANQQLGLLDDQLATLIVDAAQQVADGELDAHFPLHVWMTGSGTQTNMNVNEVISNRAIERAGGTMGSKKPVHPNDHVNMSQSSNDSFPTAMHMAAAIHTHERLLPGVERLRQALTQKAGAWKDIVKIGRTHMQDATPITLGQEFSGYASMLEDDIARIRHALGDVYQLTLGGTAVGTGLNAPAGFAEKAIERIAQASGLAFRPAENRFAYQGAHDALVALHGSFRTLATSLTKIANDIRLLSCGPRCGLNELALPENEPGSSIMPGKVNPTQCEALSMIGIQVMANDVAVGMANASGILEMNVYKPVMINAVLQSIRTLGDGAHNFAEFLVDGMTPNRKVIQGYVDNSLMLVTALSPEIGYDRASKVAHKALEDGSTLKDAALALGYVDEATFDRIVDPQKMLGPDPQ